MDLATFRQLLARSGTDLDLWPADMAEAARALMVESGEAREALVEALAAEPPVPAGDEHRLQVDRIMDALRDG